MQRAHPALLLSLCVAAFAAAWSPASAADEVEAAGKAPAATTNAAAPKPTSPAQDAGADSAVSELHVAAGLECASCHGPAEQKAPVESDRCLECHTSFEEVAKRTVALKPNPHANHYVETGVAECVGCHHGHQPRTLLCTECHTVRFERTGKAR